MIRWRLKFFAFIPVMFILSGCTKDLKTTCCPTPMTEKTLLGAYRGGGTGESGCTWLELRPRGVYTALKMGCMGVYGEEKGSWHLVHSQIVLSASSKSGWQLPKLQQLDVRYRRGEVVLFKPKGFGVLPSNEDDYFRRQNQISN
jgi:hypothetical protein